VLISRMAVSRIPRASDGAAHRYTKRSVFGHVVQARQAGIRQRRGALTLSSIMEEVRQQIYDCKAERPTSEKLFNARQTAVPNLVETSTTTRLVARPRPIFTYKLLLTRPEGE